MTGAPTQPDRYPSLAPHPLIRRTILLLAAGFVVAAWGFSTGRGYIRLAVCVVTALVAVAVILSTVLTRIGRASRRQEAEPTAATSFRDWASGQFGTCDGNIKASLAAIEILLPIAAAVVGLTAFAIIRDIVAS